jgi:putative FmdB family regulatory protein
MPIYEFKCHQCGREFEELVFKSDPTISCPDCGSGDCEKWMSTFRAKTASSNGIGDFGSSTVGSACGGCNASSCAGCGVSH